MNPLLRAWIDSRTSKWSAPKLMMVRDWNEADWEALRERLASFPPSEDPVEQSREGLTVQRFIKQLPRRTVNGIEYDQAYSQGLQLAALKDSSSDFLSGGLDR